MEIGIKDMVLWVPTDIIEEADDGRQAQGDST